MEKYKVKKYNKSKNSMDCTCKKDAFVMCEGTMTRTLPYGFGFHPNGKFAVDSVKYSGYFGYCMDCNSKVFNWTTKKAITKYPKSINNKLAEARLDT